MAYLSQGGLNGKSVLLLGASAGIGFASAIVLANAGANVTITARSEPRLKSACEKIRKTSGNCRINWLTCDAYNEQDVAETIDKVVAVSGRLDAVISVAGGDGHGGPIHLMDKEGLEQTISFGVAPTFLLLKYAVPRMIDSGGGSIVAVSSVAAVMPSPFMGGYSAGKAALEAIIKTAADELGGFNIRVNAVRPGFTRTASTTTSFEMTDYVQRYLDQQSLKTIGESEHVASLIKFLVGPESCWITGQCINVDGGLSLHRIPRWEGSAMGYPMPEEWRLFRG